MGQAQESIGTRAQGMGGAFVGVADDASAVYWNPAGLARGAFFSLVLDGNAGQAVPGDDSSGGSRSGWLLALSMPALGLSYYRLETSAVRPSALQGPDTFRRVLFRFDSLVTHHVGATLVQSVTDGVAVGTTLKLVRGLAGSADVTAGDPREILDHFEIPGLTGSRFDLDVGVMAAGTLGRVGVTVRNVTEPSFRAAPDGELRLAREVRAGASLHLLPGWKLASDVDLTRNPGVFGAVREFAVGTEAQVTRRLATRAGMRLNTAGDAGRTPAVSVGGTYGILGSVLVDVQVTAGPDRTFRGWGVAGRMVF